MKTKTFTVYAEIENDYIPYFDVTMKQVSETLYNCEIQTAGRSFYWNNITTNELLIKLLDKTKHITKQLYVIYGILSLLNEKTEF